MLTERLNRAVVDARHYMIARLRLRACSSRRRKVFYRRATRVIVSDQAKRRLIAWGEKLRLRRIITRTDLDLLRALTRFHNLKTGRCFPSYASLMKAAGCARSAVAAGLKRLEAAALIVVEQTFRIVDGRPLQASNSYVLVAPEEESKVIQTPVANEDSVTVSAALTSCGDLGEWVLARFRAANAARAAA